MKPGDLVHWGNSWDLKDPGVLGVIVGKFPGEVGRHYVMFSFRGKRVRIALCLESDMRVIN